MNNLKREEAKKWAALFQAIADGESLQRYNHMNIRWEDLSSDECPNVHTYFPHEYRIKPKPVEFEVWYNPNPPARSRNIIGVSENCASDDNFWKEKGYTKIKVREVQD